MKRTKPTPKHRFNVNDEVQVVKDLSDTEAEMVGCIAKVLELLPTQAAYPQYKVLIFGANKVKGGVFEVDEREIERHFAEKPTTTKRGSA